MDLDTTREADEQRLAALRALDGSVRLKQALELSESVRRIAEQGKKDRDLRRQESDAA